MARKTYTFEDRKNIVESREYELIEVLREKDKNGRSIIYIIIKCNQGHKTKMKWDNFMQGKNCKYCANNVKFTYDEVKEYIESFSDCKLLSNEYINEQKKLKIKCLKCNNDYEVSYHHFKNNHSRCPKCAIKRVTESHKHNYDYVKEYIENFGYKLLSNEYNRLHDKLDIECNKGHVFKMTFSKFYHENQRCPICNESKGGREISKILDKYNIEYIPQYKFKDCKFKQQLPFDFYLPKYNCCIEYDGNQHYEIIEWFGGLDKFINTKIRDTIKNDYCKNNNINLIRVPYWEFDNIEEILKHEFLKHE